MNKKQVLAGGLLFTSFWRKQSKFPNNADGIALTQLSRFDFALSVKNEHITGEVEVLDAKDPK